MFIALQDSELIMQYYEKARALRSRRCRCLVTFDTFPALCEAEQILVKLHRQNSHWFAILAAAAIWEALQCSDWHPMISGAQYGSGLWAARGQKSLGAESSPVSTRPSVNSSEHSR